MSQGKSAAANACDTNICPHCERVVAKKLKRNGNFKILYMESPI